MLVLFRLNRQWPALTLPGAPVGVNRGHHPDSLLTGMIPDRQTAGPIVEIGAAKFFPAQRFNPLLGGLLGKDGFEDRDQFLTVHHLVAVRGKARIAGSGPLG